MYVHHLNTFPASYAALGEAPLASRLLPAVACQLKETRPSTTSQGGGGSTAGATLSSAQRRQLRLHQEDTEQAVTVHTAHQPVLSGRKLLKSPAKFTYKVSEGRNST
jgi:uncharacterized membrane protein